MYYFDLKLPQHGNITMLFTKLDLNHPVKQEVKCAGHICGPYTITQFTYSEPFNATCISKLGGPKSHEYEFVLAARNMQNQQTKCFTYHCNKSVIHCIQACFTCNHHMLNLKDKKTLILTIFINLVIQLPW